MKKSIYLYILSAGLLTVTACKKDFLQRDPITSITTENFFNSISDLDTYTNGLLNTNLSGGAYDDIGSDNVIAYTNGTTLESMMMGNLSADNAGGWGGWSNIRSVNMMLENVGKTSGDPVAIRSYVGIARYFRAQIYIGLIKQYSDVPWYNKTMQTNDQDLFKAQDSRSLVADSVLADLEYAAANVTATMGNKTRVHKWVALSLLSRFCLYEGTYRKYHPELNLANDSQRFLERAASAAKQIMDSGLFSITGSDATAYRNLFISTTLNGNNEIIQWAHYDKALSRGNNAHIVLGAYWGLSKSLMETFLMKDGTPFTQTAGAATKTYKEVFADRDPRFAEVISPPGYEPTPGTGSYIMKPTTGGYDQIKFYPRDPSLRQGWTLNYTSLPTFRYAETLLNYAEAKAELGTITQGDLDISINRIRSRVGMPGMSLGTANSVIDPVLASYYPNVSGVSRGAILEIRRERRVELACEGFRFDDVSRWYAGKHFADPAQGIYVPQLGAFDTTGDGIADIAIVAKANDPITAIPGSTMPSSASSVVRYSLDDSKVNFYLSNGTSGYIMFKGDRDNNKQFIEPQYYYRPIPKQQTVLNPSLKQPFGW